MILHNPDPYAFVNFGFRELTLASEFNSSGVSQTNNSTIWLIFVRKSSIFSDCMKTNPKSSRAKRTLLKTPTLLNQLRGGFTAKHS